MGTSPTPPHQTWCTPSHPFQWLETPFQRFESKIWVTFTIPCSPTLSTERFYFPYIQITLLISPNPDGSQLHSSLDSQGCLVPMLVYLLQLHQSDILQNHLWPEISSDSPLGQMHRFFKALPTLLTLVSVYISDCNNHSVRIPHPILDCPLLHADRKQTIFLTLQLKTMISHCFICPTLTLSSPMLSWKDMPHLSLLTGPAQLRQMEITNA